MTTALCPKVPRVTCRCEVCQSKGLQQHACQAADLPIQVLQAALQDIAWLGGGADMLVLLSLASE